MKTPLTALCVTAVLLAGCASVRQSRLNPFNWFGSGSQDETLAASVEGENIVIDRRGLVQQVIAMRVEKTPGGAIIHATGLPPTQGYWDAELIAQNGELPAGGVLSYQFRIQKPVGFERTSTPPSREVTVAHFISDHRLQAVRQIRIVAAQNARSSRR